MNTRYQHLEANYASSRQSSTGSLFNYRTSHGTGPNAPQSYQTKKNGNLVIEPGKASSSAAGRYAGYATHYPTPSNSTAANGSAQATTSTVHTSAFHNYVNASKPDNKSYQKAHTVLEPKEIMAKKYYSQVQGQKAGDNPDHASAQVQKFDFDNYNQSQL